MPQLIEVPGQGIVEFPDNMNDEQIASAIKRNSAPQKKEIGIGGTDTSQLKAFARGGVEGALNLGRGVEQLYLKGAEKLGIVPRGTEKKYVSDTEESRKAYSELPYIKEQGGHAFAGELIGGLLPTLPIGAASIPLRAAGAAKSASAIKNVLTSNPARIIASGAGQGAIVGGLQYDPTNEERIKNIIYGTALGGGIPAGYLGASRLFKGAKTPDAAELAKLSKEHGIDLTVPELRGSVGGKYVESLMEKVPGTGYIGFREKQAGQFKNQAEKLAEKFGGELKDDFGSVVKNSLKGRLKENKKEASAEFDKVGKLAEKAGGKVDFNSVKQEAQNIASELSEIPEAFIDKKLVADVNRFLSLDDQSFKVARQLRSKLGDEVSQLKKAANTGTVEANQYRMATRLFDSLENDIDNFATNAGGELKKTYEKAREIYRNKVVPFKKDQLAKVMEDNYDTDLLIGGFLKPGREILASKLIKNVDKSGLQATRAAILNQALEKANQNEFFNAATFAKEALRLGKANKVVFAKDQLQTLEGYKKLSQAAERASSFARNPETGARLAGLQALAVGGGGALLLDQGLGVNYQNTIAGVLAGIGGARLLRSEAGRKLLTRAYHIPETAKPSAWRKLMIDATKLIGPVAATQPSVPE